ncbi:hypothetical protein IAT40_002792 [Kwoniella sp. CBS 6097]
MRAANDSDGEWLPESEQSKRRQAKPRSARTTNAFRSHDTRAEYGITNPHSSSFTADTRPSFETFNPGLTHTGYGQPSAFPHNLHPGPQYDQSDESTATAVPVAENSDIDAEGEVVDDDSYLVDDSAQRTGFDTQQMLASLPHSVSDMQRFPHTAEDPYIGHRGQVAALSGYTMSDHAPLPPYSPQHLPPEAFSAQPASLNHRYEGRYDMTPVGGTVGSGSNVGTFLFFDIRL